MSSTLPTKQQKLYGLVAGYAVRIRISPQQNIPRQLHVNNQTNTDAWLHSMVAQSTNGKEQKHFDKIADASVAGVMVSTPTIALEDILKIKLFTLWV